MTRAGRLTTRWLAGWLATVLLAAFASIPGDVLAATEIRWWHAMTDANRQAIEDLARDFNALSPEYIIIPEYRGNYGDTLRAGLAAMEAGDAPHILQVVEVGTATMMSAQGAIKPIYELMRDAREFFDPRSYLPSITSYYSTSSGEMLSFPFNSSSMVTWVNKDAMAEAGILARDIETWPGLFEAARKLRARGRPNCGFSTAWTTWAMIEQFSAWHDAPIATLSNGIDGLGAELRVNSPLHVRHLGNLVDAAKSRTFDYSGRNDEGENRLIAGECAILLSSSGFYGKLRASAKFAFDALPMPYYPDVAGAPRNSLIGGASLWVLRGKTPFEYRGVARFFAFLSETGRQAGLHQRLGYLPVTRAAWEVTRDAGFYAANPLLETALKSLTRQPPTENSRGVRLGDMVQLRDVWAEEIESALSGRKDAKAALDDSVTRGNAILRSFERRVR